MSIFLTVLDYLGAVMLLIGTAFLLIGSIGVLTLKDLYSRMHAAAKPQWLSVFLIALGTALMMRTWQWAAAALLIVILQTVSAPIGSHLMARAAYRNGEYDPDSLVADALDPEPEQEHFES
ncbi:MAG: monovalent cation/H(+) antiporter subunit G [Actinomycetaceae bacterium]|nr:monovalent cation/H(+) antiporter subunit G [Actinomycetaceae bacterium]